MNKSKTNQKAFTLVETLVAIAVLMIAIAGPLVVASRGLTAALHAREQVTASYLAQESMEAIKNRRSNAIINGTPWVDVISQCTGAIDSCDASVLNPQYIISCNAGTGGCQIYNSFNGYTNEPTEQLSIFKRYFYLTKKDPDDASDLDGKDYIVTVVVNWNQGLVPAEVRLVSELTESID